MVERVVTANSPPQQAAKGEVKTVRRIPRTNGVGLHPSMKDFLDRATYEVQFRYDEPHFLDGIVRAMQEARSRPSTPPDVGFFVVAHCLETLAFARWQAGKHCADHPAGMLWKRSEAIREQYGLAEDEEFPEGHAPREYELIWAEWDRRAAEAEIATCREFGEHEMADLLVNHPEEFLRRYNRGRLAVVGPDQDLGPAGSTNPSD
jgi:hypothetical protein